MAPRLTNQATKDQPMNEWEELRRTLLAMQENIQVTIHNSMRELAESVYLQHRRRQPSEDGSTEADGNPSAKDVQHRGNSFDFTRLQNLRQGSRSVDDYAEEFSLLLSQEILDIEVQLVSRFIGGLRPQLQNAMSQFYPLTVAEAHRRAVAVVPAEDASSQVDENVKYKDVEEDLSTELSQVPITSTLLELKIVSDDGEYETEALIFVRSDQTVRDIRNKIDVFSPEDKRDYYLKSDTGVEYRDLNTTVNRITSGSLGSTTLHQIYST